MSGPRMHPDEVPVDVRLVRGLLADQFPPWAGLPLRALPSAGTDHHLYRLGEELSVRLPRIGWAHEQAELEARWLPVLAPHLPLAVPVPVAVGRPGRGYPFRWAVHEWLPGVSAATAAPDPGPAADDLAGFIAALRTIETTGAPLPHGRGGPLAERDDAVRAAVAELGNRVDGPAALRAWDAALAAPIYDGPPVWLHGDLLPGNLLVIGDRLSAVIDFGSLAAGDPACDLQPVWHLFAPAERLAFLDALGADDAARARGRGWVLAQTLLALPYYWRSNPGIVGQSQRALAAVLADR